MRWLTLILTIAFTAGPVCAQQSSEAYFVFDSPPHPETFVFKLTDPQKIQQARDIISSGASKIVSGTIIKQPVYYNAPWSYYLDPKSITFTEIGTEVCDATIRYLEDNLDIAYPHWCPYSSHLLREIPAPTKPGDENLAPNVSMTFPYADDTFGSVSPVGVTLVANADDPDGVIAKVSFHNGTSVIGEITTYPYTLTWHPLAAGTYTVFANATDNNGVVTTSRSVTFLISGGPPQLLTDGDGSNAAALESVTLRSQPFTVISEHSFSSDQRTRVLLFGVNLELRPDEDLTAIKVEAEDAQHRKYLLPVEAVSTVPQFPWLSQATVKLPDELYAIGDVWLSVLLRGVQSNKVLIKIN